jgi:hypothetical protein
MNKRRVDEMNDLVDKIADYATFVKDQMDTLLIAGLRKQAMEVEAAGKTSPNPEVEGASGSSSSRGTTTQEPAGDPSSSRPTKRQREDSSGNPSKEPCWAQKVSSQVRPSATNHLTSQQLRQSFEDSGSFNVFKHHVSWRETARRRHLLGQFFTITGTFLKTLVQGQTM